MRFTIQYQDKRISNKFKIEKDYKQNKLIQVDRFMIAKKLRGSSLSFKYMLWIYKFALNKNVHMGFIEIEKHLLKLYEKFGFIPYTEIFVDKEKKQKRILCYLMMKDRNNLERAKSPFLSILDTFTQRTY